MSNITYFFRRNNWIFKLIFTLPCVVFIVTLPGSVFLWIGKGTAPTEWLIWLAISFVATFASGMLGAFFGDNSFCKKCGRTGVKMNLNPPSYGTTYQCGYCGNTWEADDHVLGSNEHPRGCQCYDCRPWG